MSHDRKVRNTHSKTIEPRYGNDRRDNDSVSRNYPHCSQGMVRVTSAVFSDLDWKNGIAGSRIDEQAKHNRFAIFSNHGHTKHQELARPG